MEVHKLKCDRLIPPRQPTYDAVGDYQVSKWLTRKFPKATEGDDVLTGSVAISLSIAKRGLYDAEVRLKAKRQYEAQQRKVLDGKWKELELKERELRENFIRFNEFVKENENKRDRAKDQKKACDEQASIRGQKLNELMMEYEDLKTIKKLMDDKLNEYSIYEDYLCKVAERYPDYFTDIHDILKRHETLMSAKKFLNNKQQADLNTLQAEINRLRHLLEIYSDKLEMMHTKLSILTERDEMGKFKCWKWEKILTDVRNLITEKALEIDEVKRTCATLYEQVCRRMEQQPVYRGNLGMQMYCIRKALRDLDMVNRKVRETREREKLASEKSVKSGSTK